MLPARLLQNTLINKETPFALYNVSIISKTLFEIEESMQVQAFRVPSFIALWLRFPNYVKWNAFQEKEQEGGKRSYKHVYEICWEKSRKHDSWLQSLRNPSMGRCIIMPLQPAQTFLGAWISSPIFFARISNQQTIVWQDITNATLRHRKCRHSSLNSTDGKILDSSHMTKLIVT